MPPRMCGIPSMLRSLASRQQIESVLLHVIHVRRRRHRVGPHQPVRTRADDAEVDLRVGVVHIVVARQPQAERGVLEPACALFGIRVHLEVDHVPRLVMRQERKHEHHAAHREELPTVALEPEQVCAEEEAAPDPARRDLSEEKAKSDVDLQAFTFLIVEVRGIEALAVVEAAVLVEYFLHVSEVSRPPRGQVHEGAMQEELDEGETDVTDDRPEQQRGNHESHRKLLSV